MEGLQRFRALAQGMISICFIPSGQSEEHHMVHKISKATSYLETFAIDLSGKHAMRSYATGFFIRTANSVYLITNWHVVSGLDPADTSKAAKPTPVFLKATVISKTQMVTELTIPLYDEQLLPLWSEHHLGSEVDLAIYKLPATLENYFDFIDVHSVEDEIHIDERVANDVFIVGYPFSRDEFKNSFGDDAPYYMPVWKRGSIAFEPRLRLKGRVLLIDALSRAGMSGSPVFLAQDVDMMGAKTAANVAPLARLASGDTSALCDLDPSTLIHGKVRNFRFLGVYSGTFGSTRLSETALGKCWHIDILRQTIDAPQRGKMPAHSPFENNHYAEILRTIEGKLVIKDADGNLKEEVPLRSMP